ncbi:hypothetical protein NKG05_25125 [Oerskovia sp. M15]
MIDPSTGDVLTSRRLDRESGGATVAFGDGLATVGWGEGPGRGDPRGPAHGERRWSRDLQVVRDAGVEHNGYLGCGPTATGFGWRPRGSVRCLMPTASRRTGLPASCGARGSPTAAGWSGTPTGPRASTRRTGPRSSAPRERPRVRCERRVTRRCPVRHGRWGRDGCLGRSRRRLDVGARPAVGAHALDRRADPRAARRAGGDVGILAALVGCGRSTWARGRALGESGVLTYSAAYTDGVDLYLVGSSDTGATRVTAVSVDSGHELWATDVSESFAWSFTAQGTLVVVTQEGSLLGLR